MFYVDWCLGSSDFLLSYPLMSLLSSMTNILISTLLQTYIFIRVQYGLSGRFEESFQKADSGAMEWQSSWPATTEHGASGGGGNSQVGGGEELQVSFKPYVYNIGGSFHVQWCIETVLMSFHLTSQHHWYSA